MNPLWQIHFALLLATFLGMPALRKILDRSKASRTNAIVGIVFLVWLTLLIELFALPVTSWLFPLQLFAHSEWLGSIILGVAISVLLFVWGLNIVFDENGSSKFWQSIWMWHERVLLRVLPKKRHDEYHWHIRWRVLLWARKLERYWGSFSLTSFLKRHRWLWVLLSGGVTALFASYFVTNGKWFTLPQIDDFKNLRDSSGSWTLLTAFISAPIAFAIWWFRDTNTLWQIENQRKDINLKDFQKLAEWASGLHLVEDKVTTSEKIEGKKGASNNKTSETTTAHESSGQPYNVVLGTPSRREGSASLQIAAVVQLQAFLNGEFGRHFEKPAFTLLTSIWLALMQKHSNAWTEISLKSWNQDDKTTREAISQWGRDLKNAANTPLAKAINYALASSRGRTLKNHHELLPGLLLTGMNYNLPGLDSLELDGLNLKGIQWQGANLKFAQLQGANLCGALLQSVNLEKSQLQNVDLSGSELQNANFKQSSLQNADLSWSEMERINLSNAQLQGADLEFSTLCFASLTNAKLQYADLSWANLKGTNFRHAQLQGATLDNIVFDEKTNFSNAETDIETVIRVNSDSDIDRTLLTHAIRIKLREENGLNLPSFRYEEFKTEWEAVSESQRTDALQLAGTKNLYEGAPF